jgi:hypothetical protein
VASIVSSRKKGADDLGPQLPHETVGEVGGAGGASEAEGR